MPDQAWTSSEVLAFTEREGPGQPPVAPRRWTAVTLAASLGVVFTAVLFTDTLCPEHRAWVNGLALTALVGAIVAVVGLLRDWAGAPIITTLTAGVGVSMGLIDTLHSPTRGRVVALAFGVVTVMAALLCTRQVRLLRWDRKLRRQLRPLDSPRTTMTTAVEDVHVAGPAPVAERDLQSPARAEQTAATSES